MSIENNITFDESQYKIKSRSILGEPAAPGLIRALIRKGVVKNENQAMGLILVTIMTLIGLSIFFVNESMTVPVAIPSPSLNANN